MWLFLKQETPFFEKPLRVLHIAPEVCFIHRFERMKNLDYITADLESPLAQIHMDIHQMPFEAGAFDVVFCNHVMEHVTDDLQAMGEILRVLRPQGWAIIQSPMDYSLVTTFEDPAIQSAQARFEAYGQEDHVRLYGLDYPERLRKAGFEVTERQYAQELPPDQVQQYALPKDEILYFCRKPA
jgi:SAM-dependent methyltransferase